MCSIKIQLVIDQIKIIFSTDFKKMSSFTVADYVIFFTSVLTSFCIGIVFAYRGRKQQTSIAYLLGNRKLRVLPVALSVAVSYQSGITMLGIPADTYMFGIVFIWNSLAAILSLLFTMQITVPLFHPLKITSIYEVCVSKIIIIFI